MEFEIEVLRETCNRLAIQLASLVGGEPRRVLRKFEHEVREGTTLPGGGVYR